MKHFFLTSFVFLAAMISSYAQLAGSWKGALEVQGMKINLVFNFTEENKAYSGTMDSPDQGAVGIPLTKVDFNNNEVTFSLSQAGITYKGALNGNAIAGTFTQAGMDFPLTLTKTTITKPGNPALVSSDAELKALVDLDKGNYKYSVEDYFKKPNSSRFQLSPDGKYLSYMEKDNNKKNHVYVKEVATGKIIRAIEEKEELIRGYGWINENRLLYVMDKGGDENYHIYAVDLDGKNLKDLTPYEGVKASILNNLKEQKDYMIISMNKDNKQVFEPYKVNVNTGALEKLYENTDVESPIMGYDFDKDGNLRAFSKFVNGVESQLYFRLDGEKEFKLFHQTKWDEGFSILSFNYASTNKDEAYVVTNLDSDKSRVVLYDFKKRAVVKEIYSHPVYDVAGLSLSRKRNWEIDNISYEGEKGEIIPVSNHFKKMYSNLQKQFKGYEIGFAGKTNEEDKYLVVIGSDKLYGKYYIYDTKTEKATLLYDLMPQLKEGDMAEMRPISFKSRDGMTIHGYITLPKAALQGKKVPLVVNPHGGPQGVRDSWGFNPESQLFASRGYATLQVNFRISGGYGKSFLRAGFKQIGRKLMDDVEDGVKYVIEQGWVDPAKIAIYGGSHGGYATLMGLVKTPDLYTCGVDYVGVSNIETFFSSFPEYWKPYKEMVKQIWYDLDNPEEAKIAKEVSPVYQLDKIKKPLFVVQGANDPRVKIAESDQIVEGLRAKGFNVPYMVKYDEGHGFAKEENSIEFYKAMMGFLSQNLK